MINRAIRAGELSKEATAKENVNLAWINMETEYITDKENNISVDFNESFIKSKLNEYIGNSGEVTSLTKNQDGSYKVVYEEQGKEYFFTEFSSIDGRTNGGNDNNQDNSVVTAVVGEFVENTNKPYTKNGTAIIPVGFRIVAGNDDVSEGLCIEDRQGNEFVWIPCANYTADNEQIYDEESLTEDSNIAQSITNNGGFYVSRYEMTSATSKKDQTATTGVNLNTAVTTARGMYSKESTYYGAASTLMYGKQWDKIISFIGNTVDTTSSSLYGNYADTEYQKGLVEGHGVSFLRRANEKKYLSTISNQLNSQYAVSEHKSIDCSLINTFSAFNIKAGQTVNNAFSLAISNAGLNSNSDALAQISISVDNKDYISISEGTNIGGYTVDIEGNLIKVGNNYGISIASGASSSSISFNIEGIEVNDTKEDIDIDFNITVDCKVMESNQASIDLKPIIEIAYNEDDNLIVDSGKQYAWVTMNNEQTFTAKNTITIKANNVLTTGNKADYKVKNIYDLAGNLEEWTLEKDNNGKYAARGGAYYNKGTENSITSKNFYNETTTDDALGYRVALYVK